MTAREPQPADDARSGGNRRLRLAATLAVVVAVLAVGGILLQGRLSEDSYAEQIEQRCSDVNERFRADLALQDAFGDGNDLEILGERIELIEALRRQVDELEVPEDTSPPDGWLATLDTFVAKMKTFKGDYEHARPGSDLVLALGVNIVHASATEAGDAAARYGLGSCSDVDSWLLIPESSGA